MRRVLVRRVYRTGVQTVEHDAGADQCYVTIRNRRYASEHPVSHETAKRYYEKMSA